MTNTNSNSVTKRMTKSQRWVKACSEAEAALHTIVEMQSDYQSILDSMEGGLLETPYGQKLDEICNLDIQSALDTVEECSQAELPLGFGRD